MALSRAGTVAPTVLVLRALGLGDLLTSVPALRGVRQAFPDARLLLATDPALRDLVDLADVAADIVPAHGLHPPVYDGPPPEVAVNLHGRGPQSHRLLASLRPMRLIAFGCAEAGVDGPRWRRDEHEVARWCRLLDESLGLVTDPTDLRLPAVAEEEGFTGVLVHPGAAQGARRWPPERYAALARRLADLGERVWVTGSPTEHDLAERVAAQAGLPPGSVLAGRTPLRRLAGLVSRASLVVCGDTGMAHLATAFATPSVVLFGPTPPAWWGPPSDGPHVALWHGRRPGDPWADHPDPALLQITVEEVAGACETLLAAVRRRGPLGVQ